jgi:hypothetical protein
MQRHFFPVDKTLHDIIKSDEFQKLLETDATTEEGQDYIVQYYEVATDWKAFKKQGGKKGTIAYAASASYYLLKTV